MLIFHQIIIFGVIFYTLVFGQSIEIKSDVGQNIYIHKNQPRSVKIYLYNIENLESMQLEIEYNTSIIELNEFIFNPSSNLHGGYKLENNSSQGNIKFGVYLTTSEILSGDFLIAELFFNAIGNIGDISEFIFKDYHVNGMYPSIVNAQIEILFHEMYISGRDNLGVASPDTIYFGMIEGGHDGWDYGEDQYDIRNPNIEYVDLEFLHYDWQGELDDSTPPNVCCDQFDFSHDYRSMHSNYEIQTWGVSGSTGNGLPLENSIILSWDSDIISNVANNFNLYIYVSDIGYDMSQQNSITILQSELGEKNLGNPNIIIKLGYCANNDTPQIETYYYDYDMDGLGSDISAQYCVGTMPEGWVINSNDLDDYCFSNNIDCAGICDGQSELDCSGECEGGAIIDSCGICQGNNMSCTDCNGDLNGVAFFDGCGTCIGGNTGEIACPYDCLGVPNGTSIIDNCGNCTNGENGGRIECSQDCAGVWGGELVLDECGICGGPGATSDCGCSSIPEGFCDCNGNQLDICGVCGGDNSLCTDCSGVINGGAYLDGCLQCVGGNTGEIACPFDCFGIAGGLAIIDECGICGGSGISVGECDCQGNIFDECGICGGSGIPVGDCDCDGNVLDECGICGGNGIPVDDCDCNGNKKDCANICGGNAEIDDCDICDNDPANDNICFDCNGIKNGGAKYNNCGDCELEGETIPCEMDCAGIWGGILILDECGVCNGSGLCECNNGTLDCSCCCDEPNKELDCNNVCGGSASTNNQCNICIGGDTGRVCEKDCTGQWGGNAFEDNCGVCDLDENNNDQCLDCNGDKDGLAYQDNCGECIGGNTILSESYECTMDCDDVWGGNHSPSFYCLDGTFECNASDCIKEDSSTNSDTTIVLGIGSMPYPDRIQISKIYPNPFNPHTTINFEISEPSYIQLDIYNLIGQKIDSINNNFMLPGYYSVEWNGSNFSSGIYFVILHSNKTIVRQKMILLK